MVNRSGLFYNINIENQGEAYGKAVVCEGKAGRHNTLKEGRGRGIRYIPRL